jgi:hypothetical protein
MLTIEVGTHAMINGFLHIGKKTTKRRNKKLICSALSLKLNF